jgi:hypothetical protein
MVHLAASRGRGAATLVTNTAKGALSDRPRSGIAPSQCARRGAAHGRSSPANKRRQSMSTSVAKRRRKLERVHRGPLRRAASRNGPRSQSIASSSTSRASGERSSCAASAARTTPIGTGTIGLPFGSMSPARSVPSRRASCERLLDADRRIDVGVVVLQIRVALRRQAERCGEFAFAAARFEPQLSQMLRAVGTRIDAPASFAAAAR